MQVGQLHFLPFPDSFGETPLRVRVQVNRNMQKGVRRQSRQCHFHNLAVAVGSLDEDLRAFMSAAVFFQVFQVSGQLSFPGIEVSVESEILPGKSAVHQGEHEGVGSGEGFDTDTSAVGPPSIAIARIGNAGTTGLRDDADSVMVAYQLVQMRHIGPGIVLFHFQEFHIIYGQWKVQIFDPSTKSTYSFADESRADPKCLQSGGW